ncbi:bifunctional adenosylcobinamide kinase/adenosylcobinamide-phosphate guanylyltransferase [Litorilituus lipolyticus]|uniref:Bifunctional adenosylcobalamin biosynthesis protein n=1 Tax=Litorilituus lipolyticus TaxID=2491017 RepID=A0A502KVE5_9GAMM|nr:bifunctional adenosylcobinamide kinase/adenosylcobinamide-phosphate guanylyltransferase [Litorilituus lipolyticus]TPH15730.1 bifunctional adenosylcobinamide kinase/adenosylcobinamide-phosphate guanylyltransferase [Litorilituus lipolyticus]
MTIHLILGGARSGKSSYAEKQAKQFESTAQAQVHYLATGQALDDEMSARITKHQQQRPTHWQLTEASTSIAGAIKGLIQTHQSQYQQSITIIVDCLTLWLTNCLCASKQGCWQYEKQALLDLLTEYEPTDNVTLLLVSNEVGHGIVPMGELSREFVDQAGWLHQEIAEIATQVDFIMAGIPLTLKRASSQPKAIK